MQSALIAWPKGLTVTSKRIEVTQAQAALAMCPYCDQVSHAGKCAGDQAYYVVIVFDGSAVVEIYDTDDRTQAETLHTQIEKDRFAHGFTVSTFERIK